MCAKIYPIQFGAINGNGRLMLVTLNRAKIVHCARECGFVGADPKGWTPTEAQALAIYMRAHPDHTSVSVYDMSFGASKNVIDR